MLESIKTLLNGILVRMNKINADIYTVNTKIDTVNTKLENTNSVVDQVSEQPDWNETNTASHAFIKGKPCYNYVEPNCVIYETSSAGISGQSSLTLTDLIDGYLMEGGEYKLTVDDVETVYTCNADESGNLYIGAGYANPNGSIFQYGTTLEAYTDNLWLYGKSVKLEGALRRYKKLDTSFYDSVTSVNGNTGDIEITPESIGAAEVGNYAILSTLYGGVIYGKYGNDKISNMLALGKNAINYSNDTFKFVSNARLTGLRNPTGNYDAANKLYVDTTISDALKLTSPDGSTWTISVDDDGTLSAVKL